MYKGHNMTLCVFELLKRKDFMEEVVQEVDKFFSEKKVEEISPSDLKSFVKLEAAIKETLRLYPQATIHPLISLKDSQIGDFYVPKSTVCAINTTFLHRSHIFWQKPNEFLPERWLEGFQETPLPEGVTREMVYAPFLKGRHTCIVRKFLIIFPFFLTPKKNKGNTFGKT